MLQETPRRLLHDPGSVMIETERLTLRAPIAADAQAIVDIVSDKRVSINLRRVPHPYALADAVDFIATVASAGTETVFLVEHGRKAIGIVGLSWGEDGVPELGYCFAYDYWGKGFATEAARATIDYAFDEFAVDRIKASARVLNPASRHVLEKCGFNWTGVELHRFLALGSSTPVDCFKLERSVWSSLKSWGEATRRA